MTECGRFRGGGYTLNLLHTGGMVIDLLFFSWAVLLSLLLSLGRFSIYLFSLGGGSDPSLLGSGWVRVSRGAGSGSFSQDNPQDLVAQLRLHIACVAEDLH